MKCSGRDGAIIWEQDKSIPSDATPYVARVAIDRVGNVCILGYISQTSGEGGGDDAMPARIERDYTSFFPYIARYVAPDGALIWEKSPRYLYEESLLPIDLGMDPAGNVYLTGYRLLAAKYAAADGSELWRVPMSNQANGRLLSIDSGGDPVFCAEAFGPFSRVGQFHTGKLDARNGNVLWSKNYPNGPRRNTHPIRMALGPGIVAVAGETSNQGTTVKYADGPTPRTLAAEVLDSTITRLHGEVIPNRFISEAAFIYGTDPALREGIRTEFIPIGKGVDAIKVEATVSSLSPHTRYYYCVFGRAAEGETVRGEVRTLDTISTP